MAVFLLSIVAFTVNAATFTSSLPLEPEPLLKPFGETITIILPDGLLDLPELPENEYYGNVTREYHWQVIGGPGGDGRTATINSSTSGGTNVISSPGCYTLTFTGKATYTICWQENGAEKSSGPHNVTLTPSQGGRLTMTFWLIGTSHIEISGNEASGTVSDQTSNLLRGTKYTFRAYRTPANSPGWPSGQPVWSSSGIGISPNGDECVGTFYSGGEGKTLTTSCGAISKTATFNSVTPQIQRVEFHWDSQGIHIHDLKDKWQAAIGGLTAVNDPACYVQGQKGKARLKFHADKNLTFPVAVSLRGDVHWLDEYITGEDYGRDTMTFGTDWSNTGIVESEANAEAKVKDDYDVDISWRYKVRSPNGSNEWIDTGDTDNLRYYLVWARPQFPQESPWNRVLEMAVDWAEGDESAEEALGHVTEEIYNSGFVYDVTNGHSSFINDGIFYLSSCLDTWGNSSVNCADTSNICCIFGNAIGCNSSITMFIHNNTDLDNGYYVSYLINYVKLLGRQWANSISNQVRKGFDYHAISSIISNIYDPCLLIDNDSDPTQSPHTGLLPKGLLPLFYLNALVDPLYLGNIKSEEIDICEVIP